jgi:hypothetical protein
VREDWLIGQEIIEEEQFGEELTKYGMVFLKGYPTRLLIRYKKDVSVHIKVNYISYLKIAHLTG